MSKYEEYKKAFPNKTDKQMVESLCNEVSQKGETIRELLNEIQSLRNKISVNDSFCPKCNSVSITKTNTQKWCDDCGNVWR